MTGTLGGLTEKQRAGLEALAEAEETENLSAEKACERRGVSEGYAHNTRREYPELYEEVKQKRANSGLPNGEENGSVESVIEEPGPFREADTRVRLSREQVEEAVERYVGAELISVPVEVLGVEYEDGEIVVGADFD